MLERSQSLKSKPCRSIWNEMYYVNVDFTTKQAIVHQKAHALVFVCVKKEGTGYWNDDPYETHPEAEKFGRESGV